MGGPEASGDVGVLIFGDHEIEQRRGMNILRMEEVNFMDARNALLNVHFSKSPTGTNGWFLSEKKGVYHDEFESNPTKEEPTAFDGWSFDSSYFETRGDGDEGNYAEFRLVKGDSEMFLTIYNHHYNSIDFTFLCFADESKNRNGSI